MIDGEEVLRNGQDSDGASWPFYVNYIRKVVSEHSRISKHKINKKIFATAECLNFTFGESPYVSAIMK